MTFSGDRCLPLRRLTPQNLFWLVEGVPWLGGGSPSGETEGVNSKLAAICAVGSLVRTPSVFLLRKNPAPSEREPYSLSQLR